MVSRRTAWRAAVREWTGADLDRHLHPVLAYEHPLGQKCIAPPEFVGAQRCRVAVGGIDQVGDPLAEDLLPGVAEHGATGGVDIDVGPFGVGDEDTVGGLLHEGPVALLAGAKLLLRLLAIGDVVRDAEQAVRPSLQVEERALRGQVEVERPVSRRQ